MNSQKIVTILVSIVAFVGAYYGVKYVISELTQPRLDTTKGRTEYLGVFSQSCEKEASTYSTPESAKQYCTCAFEEVESMSGGWYKVGSWYNTASEEQVTAAVSPCLKYIQVQ
jgi:hypothetical protein